MPDPPPLTGWRNYADRGLTSLVSLVKGATGLGDQGPAGPTLTNAAALLASLVPLATAEKSGASSLRKVIDTYVNDPTIDDAAKHFTGAFPRLVRAGEQVDGRTVRAGIPNESSIGASLMDYDALPGVREVPFSVFGDLGPVPKTGRVDELRRTQQLTDAIRYSREISPLIVAIDREGPYVLEGAHRFDALRHLGAESFPAKVVLDLEDLHATGR